MDKKNNRKDFKEISEKECKKVLVDIFKFKECEAVKSIEEIKKYHNQITIKNDLSKVTVNCVYYDIGNLYTLWGIIK